jgi:hypothetical protein
MLQKIADNIAGIAIALLLVVLFTGAILGKLFGLY